MQNMQEFFHLLKIRDCKNSILFITALSAFSFRIIDIYMPQDKITEFLQFILLNGTFYAFGRCFYPQQLTVHPRYTSYKFNFFNDQ